MRYGIELVKPTGKVDSNDPQYIEVLISEGNSMFARPCYPFGFVYAPSTEWLDKYKDEILIAVVYENGVADNPLWIGYVPIDGKLSDIQNFPKQAIFRTKNFILKFEDDNDALHIQQRDSSNTVKQQITLSGDECWITSDKIRFTKQAPSQDAVLGNKLKDDILQKLCEELEKLTVNTAMGPSSIPVNVAAITAIKGQLSTILSGKVKLD